MLSSEAGDAEQPSGGEFANSFISVTQRSSDVFHMNMCALKDCKQGKQLCPLCLNNSGCEAML
eukprot:1156744-Pelagomonas_calceolata.AAC.1